nr:5-formyltetrahydrofolate cyclo-ligase [uncultured Gellertiella sp.]
MTTEPLADAASPGDRARIMAWRKTERARLLAARMALAPDVRKEASARIATHLDRIIGDVRGRSVSLYWPFRGEPDLRSWLERITQTGGRGLLPVVTENGHPLTFRPWKEGEPLVKGVWNIPVPATEETGNPDICIAPVVGFDAESYRLGYGGGFFDRTLASLASRPMVIGVGYAMQRIETIHPLAHDIAMDLIVTEI